MSVDLRVQALLTEGNLTGAASEAIRGLGPRVMGYLRTIFLDEDDVEDAFGQWAENLWKGLGSFEGRASFRTWALRLAWNAALNMRDQAHRRRERRLLSEEISVLVEEVRSNSTIRVEHQRQELGRMRSLLSREEQTLLFLRLDQELSWPEVAQILSADGAPVDADTVCKRFERLKARLARLAREQGLLE